MGCVLPGIVTYNARVLKIELHSNTADYLLTQRSATWVGRWAATGTETEQSSTQTGTRIRLLTDGALARTNIQTLCS